MKLEILPIYDALDDYINDMHLSNNSAQAIWDKFAIDPYWCKLSIYAPMDISDRKPKPITDVEALAERLEILRRINIDELKLCFEKAIPALPDYDETMYVALYPLDSSLIREQQNGVWGVCTWGNMIINIDPMANDYQKWIPYVFAHEYHHNIWSNYWFNLHGGELDNIFLNALLTDGLADSFALSLNPDLKPKWLYGMPEETALRLWEEHYSKLIMRTDVDYEKYMFGDEKSGIPWCAGYAIGFRIIQSFLKNHPNTTMAALMQIKPLDIFGNSGFDEYIANLARGE